MRDSESGFSTLEVLVALLIIALVMVSAGWATERILHIIGKREYGEHVRGARARTEASTWIQAVTEYTRKQGFNSMTASCVSYPCSFWVSQGSATVPYNAGPPLPPGFQCGRVLFRDWDGAGPVPPSQLLLITVEIYVVRTSCTDAGTGNVFIAAHSGIARR